MSDEAQAPAPKRPPYKDPFVLAFAVGVVVLTVLPFLQKPFLKAPPPLRALPAWELPALAGGPVGSASLAGRVYLGSLVPPRCDEACVERQRVFGRAVTHVDDLDGGVALVTIVWPGAEEPLRPLAEAAPPSWRFATGTPAQLEPLLGALKDGWVQWAGTDAGSTALEFSAVPAFLLVDQAGALRGFWRDDAAGRGNAINAARLLARHGPQP